MVLRTVMLWCVVSIDTAEWQWTLNETQFDYINVTHLQLEAEYQMLVVAVNDVGRTASDQMLVVVGMPYAQFGSFSHTVDFLYATVSHHQQLCGKYENCCQKP